MIVIRIPPHETVVASAGGTGADALLGFEIPEDGTYFIQVSSADGSVGHYEMDIDVDFVDPSADPEWIKLAPTGGPVPARREHSAVYNSNSNRMTIFAGRVTSRTNDAWVLSANGAGGASAWNQIFPGGTAPPVRQDHSVVFDPGSNTMIGFGRFGLTCCLNDVYLLTGADGSGTPSPAWTALATSGTPPVGRFAHTTVYDAGSNRMIVFGGLEDLPGTGLGALNDVWVLQNANGTGGLPTWSLQTPTGTPPPGRLDHTAVYDAGLARMIVFGGRDGNPGSYTNDVWVLENPDGVGGTPN